MGPDQDSEELIDAVGKKRTARECQCGGDNDEQAVIRKRSAVSEQTERRGKDHSAEPDFDRDFDAR